MSTKMVILVVGSALAFAGCATYRGGTTGAPVEYDTDRDLGESHPVPMASPSFRPGMNPEDPRDPHFTTRPQPTQSPPNTPP